MITALTFTAVLTLFLTLLFMPFWTAIATRLLFRRLNSKLLAALTALPFTIWRATRADHLSYFDSGEMHLMRKIGVWILLLSTSLLVQFGIPYLMAMELELPTG